MLLEVKLLTIDECFMISIDIWTDIDSSIGEVCVMIPKKEFASLLWL